LTRENIHHPFLPPSLASYLGGLDVVACDHADHDAGFLTSTDGVGHFGPERVLREGGREGGREGRLRGMQPYVKEADGEGEKGRERGGREGGTYRDAHNGVEGQLLLQLVQV